MSEFGMMGVDGEERINFDRLLKNVHPLDKPTDRVTRHC